MNLTNLDNDYLIITIYTSKMASGQMRGAQTYQELKQKFKHVYNVVEFNQIVEKDPKTKLLSMKTAVFLFKWVGIPSWFNQIKNKYVIWDIVDGLDHYKPIRKTGVVKGQIATYSNCIGYRKMYQICNLINCANSKQMEILSAKNPKKREFDCIPHNWDNRTRDKLNICKLNENLPQPNYVFVGTAQQRYDKIYRRFYKFKPIASKLVKDKQLGNFNVCGSFRSGDQSIPKPGTKCAVAASMNSLFIANKDEHGVYDLLGKDYPYYFTGNPTKKKIKRLINTMDRTYKTPTWDLAKKCMEQARIKSDVVTTTDNFIKHFKNYFERNK